MEFTHRVETPKQAEDLKNLLINISLEDEAFSFKNYVDRLNIYTLMTSIHLNLDADTLMVHDDDDDLPTYIHLGGFGHEIMTGYIQAVEKIQSASVAERLDAIFLP